MFSYWFEGTVKNLLKSVSLNWNTVTIFSPVLCSNLGLYSRRMIKTSLFTSTTVTNPFYHVTPTLKKYVLSNVTDRGPSDFTP